jgi:hypothetical protein
MSNLKIAMWSVGALLFTAAAASADVQLSMNNGRVSLVAKDATVRQILAEWQRVGQTRIVNAERVPGGPVTLELLNVPEAQALETILRSVSGYMAAPRAVPVANGSQFEQIIVMPTSSAPAGPARAAGGAVFPQPGMQPGMQPGYAQPGYVPPGVYPPGMGPGQQPIPADDDTDDEHPAPPVGTGRPPVFNAFPPPQVATPQQQPAAVPGVTPAQQPNPLAVPQTGQPPTTPYGGVSTPGMIVQPPQPQPGQDGQPVIPGQPQPRRPGGPGGDDPDRDPSAF